MHVKHTYSSRVSSQRKPDSASSTSVVAKRKRPLEEVLTTASSNVPTIPPLKRQRKLSVGSTASKKKQKAPLSSSSLTQLHFSIDKSTLRTCPLCNLSYTKGAPEDESLHRTHCVRVQRGMEWGKEEERESSKIGVVEVASQVKVGKSGKRGRIISCPVDCSGKIGSKISALLQTINLSLSSPALRQECIRNCKIYMFLLPQTSANPGSSSLGSSREKIVGCVVAQRISSAMAIAEEEVKVNDDADNGDKENLGRGGHLVMVDSGTGLFCHPEPLRTPMGVPRLFVPSTYRRQGIASALLDAAAANFIHGCPLDPRKGQVAFTQPTGDGKALMVRWGGGGARIYEE
ncbi:hypothetical protein AGABI1DRAFT_111363 [Agaricus bisporus var. burnettii JB137-S8]|uniref:N-acetyltransferase ECO1 n=1 Tax=Agaricus bisporus var. burnettii (strain JB137-S8 / ATCC MYA-4627 / FGSC 10392) TaxID=597362 RepID=K5XH59_AGABU|nr:uncharacterized protein AGABI1DRAFT_111363 [Agaricus bisporus var. burnettii JB137-S8]EKM82793.1 hypothetical protein AGABI1DRAFT_111363 [Agaricus bisporus var. burnettii JB137-S8]